MNCQKSRVHGKVYCPVCGKVAAHFGCDMQTAELDGAKEATKALDTHLESHGRVALTAYAPVLQGAGAVLLAFGTIYQFHPIVPVRENTNREARS